jgi:hypothetical protein
MQGEIILAAICNKQGASLDISSTTNTRLFRDHVTEVKRNEQASRHKKTSIESFNLNFVSKSIASATSKGQAWAFRRPQTLVYSELECNEQASKACRMHKKTSVESFNLNFVSKQRQCFFENHPTFLPKDGTLGIKRELFPTQT